MSGGASVVRIGGVGPDIYQTTLVVPEQLSSLTIYHALPLLVPDETVITVEGRDLEAKQLRDGIMTGGPNLSGRAAVSFRIHDSFLVADAIHAVYDPDMNEQDANHDNAPIPTSLLMGQPPRVDGDPERWLAISEGETARLAGHASSYSYDSFTPQLNLFIPDVLGTALAYHILPVVFDSHDSAWGLIESSQERATGVEITLSGGVFRAR